jgi:hypothetical protein
LNENTHHPTAPTPLPNIEQNYLLQALPAKVKARLGFVYGR